MRRVVPIAFALMFAVRIPTALAQTAQRAPTRKDIPAIAKAANGAIVSIVMSDKDSKPIAQGSGFLVSKDGLVVTNYHVIAEGNSAVVKLPDGAFYLVDGVVASDKARDIAVIKTRGTSFRTLTLGNSDRLQVGEAVVAIGNPLSLESSVSNGIVSGIRTIKEGKFLQITAPISHGSSGGPLFNMEGEVIGITAALLEGGENLNFAIPINEAKRLISNKSTRLENLPNEPPVPVRAKAEVHSGTLAQQKACREQAEILFNKNPGEAEVFHASMRSHFDPAAGICYMISERSRTPAPGSTNWVYIHSIYDAFEGRSVGFYNAYCIVSGTDCKLIRMLCSVTPAGQQEITCESEQEFDDLVQTQLGINP